MLSLLPAAGALTAVIAGDAGDHGGEGTGGGQQAQHGIAVSK